MKPLEKLFWEEIAEMLHLEGMLSKLLLKMEASAANDGLKQAFTNYRPISETNLSRLSDLMRTFERPPREKKNDAAMSLLLRCQQSIQRTGQGHVLDSLLLAHGRKIIALKVATYQSLVGWAKTLTDGKNSPVKMLEELLESEEQADKVLSRIASKLDGAAAREETIAAPKPAPKRPKETSERQQWGAW